MLTICGKNTGIGNRLFRFSGNVLFLIYGHLVYGLDCRR